MKKRYVLNRRGKIQLVATVVLIGAFGVLRISNVNRPNFIAYEAYATNETECVITQPKIEPLQMVKTQIVTEPVIVPQLNETTENEIVTETVIEECIIGSKTAPKPYDDNTVEVLTNLLYGEARGLNKTHKSAVIWCVLNRYDNGKFGKTIVEVATAKNQFCGYVKGRVYKDIAAYEECKSVVIDVLDRYYTEEQVGRTLPKDYLYFHGNGKVNLFTKVWKGTNYWNWSLESPYK